MIRKTIVLAFLLAGTALSQVPAVTPAWLLVAAETGSPAQLYLQLPADMDPHSLTAVSVPGATVSGFTVLPESGILSVAVTDARANPLVITELTIEAGAGPVTLSLAPTEVHWLDGLNRGSLVMRASQRVTGGQHALALLLENPTDAVIEITEFRYAPAAITTGELLLARGFAPLADLAGLRLPWLTGSAGPKYSDQGALAPDQWDGLTFERFSFADSGLVLEPGAQAILILAAPAFTSAELFSSQAMLGFGPWLEYTQAGQPYALQPFVQKPGLQSR